MYTRGEYRDQNGTYGVIMNHTREVTEIILIVSGQVASAFKYEAGISYSFLNTKAKEMYNIVHNGLVGCKPKNGAPIQFELGTSVIHTFTKLKVEYGVELFNGEIVGLEAKSEKEYIRLNYDRNGAGMIPPNIPYVKLTTRAKPSKAEEEEDDALDIEDELNSVPVRSVQEIMLEKEDVSWLKSKKYFIVNDDAQAEQIFSYLDNYNGVISYDTETTGLKINCFGKINSSYKKTLEKYNEEHPKEKIRADRLVGIIFCVQPDVSYYFPCFNRKFKNLYSDDTDTRRGIINNIKARYTVGEYRNRQSDMADYIRNTPADQWGSDVILMERVRNILQTKHILAHNGAFEWKVGWQYEIDTNLKDDTMIMHQIMYKFRSTTSNRGESSSLKYLAKRELGIDQWELDDFFPGYVEDSSGTVRGSGKSRTSKKNKGARIDFSYMDYDGTRIYAPTDGDVTLGLYLKYKKDMVENHREQEYIYSVEVIVACCIGYMEFYGHRIDEAKITAVRDQTKAKVAKLESEIRQLIEYSDDNEMQAYNNLLACMKEAEEASKSSDEAVRNTAMAALNNATTALKEAIEANTEHTLNLGSPAQVGELFYDILKIPFSGEKKSVAKSQVKALLKAKNEDGSKKYPVAHLYSDYKKLDTLLVKFFDNLQDYMFPGGLIFSSYGQISTATGRMSCSKPNAQQYPKDITAIVVPRDDYVMIDADYSQIEYRVLVAMSGEEHLAKLFADPDSDYHTLMASMMYSVPYASVTPKMRSDAKSFNFGIPYGMGLGSLAILLTGVNNATTRAEAAEKYELYFKDQPKTRKFFDNVKEMALVNRFTRTFWNRYRYYSFTDAEGNENNAKKAAALRQAGNAVIQGSAADIFKISVARNFMYIRENGLLGELLIINMIHDEQLFEVNYKHLNVQRVLRDIGINMQFKVEGFPPLYIGAGIGPAWAKAKGKMAEIHPLLLDQLSHEADNMPIWRTDRANINAQEILDYFAKRVLDFRKKKVRDYITNPENFGKDIHPAIGNLLNLQFTYGHDKEKEGLSDSEFTQLCLEEFIKHEDVPNITASMFVAQEEKADDTDEEDDGYEDGEDEDVENVEGYDQKSFALIDESSNIYGSSIHDLIKTFGLFVSPSHKVCGIDLNVLDYKKKEALIEFLSNHACSEEAEGAMEVVFMQEANILNRTGIYVNNIKGSELETRIKAMSTT